MSFHGTGLKQLRDRRSWARINGWTIRRPWQGTPNQVATKIAELQSAGISFDHEIQQDGSYETVIAIFGSEVTTPLDQPISDEYELLGNSLQKLLWQLPKVQAELAKFNDTDALALFKADMDAYISGQRTVEDAEGEPIPLTSISLLAIAEAFGADPTVFRGYIESRAKGTEVFQVAQWVLRRTVIVARDSTYVPNVDNIGRVYTSTAQLISIENIPPQPYPFPDGVWQKQTLHRSTVNSTKYRMTQEWWHADTYDSFPIEVAS